DETLRQEKTMLLNAEKLAQGVIAGEQLLTGGDEAIADRLGRLLSRLRELTRIDEGLHEIEALVSGSLAQVEEAAHVLHKYGARVRLNSDRLEEVDARLTLLSRLKHKYGGSIEAALTLYDAIIKELQQIEGGEEAISALRQEIEHVAASAWIWAHE